MPKEYPEADLTRVIIGCAFEVYNKLGPDYPEKIYQKALEKKFDSKKIPYNKENYCKVELDGAIVGSFRLDFLIEDKVVVELKVRDEFLSKDAAQVITYLKVNKIKVGLVILFTSSTVKIKRLVY